MDSYEVMKQFFVSGQLASVNPWIVTTIRQQDRLERAAAAIAPLKKELAEVFSWPLFSHKHQMPQAKTACSLCAALGEDNTATSCHACRKMQEATAAQVTADRGFCAPIQLPSSKSVEINCICHALVTSPSADSFVTLGNVSRMTINQSGAN
jgi:hypothetical protein